MKHNPNLRVNPEEPDPKPLVQHVVFTPGGSETSRSDAHLRNYGVGFSRPRPNYVGLFAKLALGASIIAGAIVGVQKGISYVERRQEFDAEAMFVDLHHHFSRTQKIYETQEQFLKDNAQIPNRKKLESLLNQAKVRLKAQELYFEANKKVGTVVTVDNAYTYMKTIIPEKTQTIDGIRKLLLDADSIKGEKKRFDNNASQFQRMLTEITSFDIRNQFEEKLAGPKKIYEEAMSTVSLESMQNAVKSLHLIAADVNGLKVLPEQSKKILENIVAQAKDSNSTQLPTSYYDQIQKMYGERLFDESKTGVVRLQQYEHYMMQDRVAKIISLKSVRKDPVIERYALVAPFVGDKQVAHLEFPASILDKVVTKPAWEERITEEQFILMRQRGPNGEYSISRPEFSFKQPGYMTYDRAFYRNPSAIVPKKLPPVEAIKFQIK